MALWIILAIMTAIAALFVLIPIMRAGTSGQPVGNPDIHVYADQLAEVDRDLERGTIAADEAVAARTEIARRILKADASPRGAAIARPFRGRAGAAVVVALAIPAVSLGLYARLGQPAMPDEPLLARKAKAIEKKSPEELIAMLDAQLAANPLDVKGWDLAGPIYLRMGRFDDAVTAFRTGIKLAGENAERLLGLGQALTATAQGVVTSEARAAFEAVTRLAPNLPMPKMYLALALSQDGKLAESADAWKKVIASAQPGEPWIGAARKELAAVEEKIAQGKGTPPLPGAPGDSPVAATDAPAAAPNPSGMIEAMVARLSERLDRQGGTAEDWGRLVKSYMVLGRKDAAKAALYKAHQALASDKAAIDALDAEARALGVPL